MPHLHAGRTRRAPGALLFALTLAAAALAPHAVHAQLAAPPAPVAAAGDASHTIVVGRSSGTDLPSVAADIFGAPSYVANSGAVVNGTPLDGVARLLMYGTLPDGEALLGTCSGSLLWSGRDVLTAAHCLSPLTVGLPVTRVDVQFLAPGDVFETISSTRYVVKDGYSGSVIDGGDLAMVRLPVVAPRYATRYRLFAGDPLLSEALFTGFGRCGNGLTGDAFGCGGNRLAGSNRWEVYGFESSGSIFATLAQTGVLMADLDDPAGTFDPLCFAGYGCQRGFAREVGIGRGDSGAAAFIGGRIAGVTSWGTGNFGYYSLNGHVDVQFADNRDFIVANTVPEPATLALVATGLASLAGAARRRRRGG